MLRSRILWKLFSGYVVLILLYTILVGVLVSRQVEEETLLEIEQSLDVRATLLRAVALESFSSESANTVPSGLIMVNRVFVFRPKVRIRF